MLRVEALGEVLERALGGAEVMRLVSTLHLLGDVRVHVIGEVIDRVSSLVDLMQISA